MASLRHQEHEVEESERRMMRREFKQERKTIRHNLKHPKYSDRIHMGELPHL